MAKKNKNNTKAIVGYSILCAILAAFLVFIAIGFWNHGTDLVKDETLTEYLSAYFNKAPREITKEDLATIEYLAVDGDGGLYIGDKTVVSSQLENAGSTDGNVIINDVNDLLGLGSGVNQNATALSFSAQFDFAEFVATLPNIKYLSISGDNRIVTSAKQIASAKNLEYLVIGSENFADLNSSFKFFEMLFKRLCDRILANRGAERADLDLCIVKGFFNFKKLCHG